MDRRTFMRSVAAGLVALPLPASAQSAAMPVIGYLGSASPEQFTPYIAGFRRGLNETGFVEGKNVAIEFRWAEGHFDRLPALASDLVRRQVSVILATGAGGGASAAKAATSTIPIVFTTSRDPAESGLVPSLSHPSGNLTGVNFLATDLGEKRLELLHALVPKASVVAFVVNPTGVFSESRVRKLQETARASGLQLQLLRASNEQEIDAVFATFRHLRPGALLVDSDVFFNERREQFVALAARYAVPAIYDLREYVDAGGLMSYGASLPEAYRLAGIYVGKILNGAKPADLPVVQSTKIELAINLKTAKALGLAVPQSVRLRADDVIE